MPEVGDTPVLGQGRADRERMRKLILILMALLVVAVAGGVVFLGTWELPPPTEPVVKPISNDRFER